MINQDERRAAEYLKTRDQRLLSRYLEGRFFRGTVWQVLGVAPPLQVRVTRTDGIRDSTAYQVIGDYLPLVGDDVLMVYTDESSAICLGPVLTKQPQGVVTLADLAPTSGTNVSFAVPSYIRSLRLEIVIVMAGGVAVDVAIQLNGDGGAHYSWQENAASGAAGSYASGLNAGYIRIMALAAATLGGQVTANLHNLQATNVVKHVDSTGARFDSMTAPFAHVNAGIWNSLAPVNSILVGITGGSFAPGTSIRARGFA